MQTPPDSGRITKFPALVLAALFMGSLLAGIAIVPQVGAANAGARPAVTGAAFLDSNNNGHLDRVEMVWSEEINDNSVRPQDFLLNNVPGSAFDTATTVAIPDSSSSPPPNTNGASDAYFSIIFPEYLDYNAGPQTGTTFAPVLTYAPDVANDGLVDLDGNCGPTAPAKCPTNTASSMPLLASCPPAVSNPPPCAGAFGASVFSSYTKTDLAKPQFKGAYAVAGSKLVYAVFTESVGTAPVASPGTPGTPGGGSGQPAITDFCYSGSASNPIASISGSGRIFTITLTNPLSAADVAPATAQTLQAGGTGTCNTNLFEDTSSNVLSGSKVQALGAPSISRVYAGEGDNQVIVEFSGPVSNDGTGAVTGGSGGTYFGLQSGSTCGGVVCFTRGPVTGFAGSDRVLINAGNAPIAQDFAGAPATPTTLNVQLNAVRGWTKAANAPVVDSTISVPFADSSVATTPLGHPYITSLQMLDIVGTPNGYPDTVQVTLNENINDTLSFAAGDWAIQVPDQRTATLSPANLITPTAVLTAPRTTSAFPDGVTSSGSTTLTSASAAFTVFDVGQRIDGAGIVPGTVISAVNSATSVTLSAAATGPAASFTIGKDDNVLYLRFDEQIPNNPPTATKPRAYAGTIVPTVATNSTLFVFYSDARAGATACIASCVVDKAGNKMGGPVPPVPPAAVVPYKRPTSDSAPPALKEAKTKDLDFNGKIDAVLLVFSEPIAAGSFDYTQWTAVDASNTNNAYTITGQDTSDVTDTTAGGLRMYASGTTVKLLLSPHSTPDTATLLKLTYTGGSGANPSRFIQDALGNKMANINAGAVAPNQSRLTTDGARPVLLSLTGTTGSTTVVATFSEPVKHLGTTGTCVSATPSACPFASDFNYVDNTGGAGANQVVSSTFDPAATPDPNKVILTVNNGAASPPGLTSADIGSDCMQLQASLVDAVTVTSSQAANPGYLPYTVSGTPCKGFVSGTSPLLTSASTFDANHDGSLDAIKLKFSSSVNDQFGSTSNWQVKFGTTSATIRGVSSGANRAVFNDGVTAASTTVNSATAAFTASDVGIAISGGTIPAGATITAVISATQVTISAAASTPATSVVLRLGRSVASGDVGTCPYGAATATSAGLTPGASADDTIFVCFDPILDGSNNLAPNTGARPTVTYSGVLLSAPNGGGGVGQFANVIASDGAQPVLATARTNGGSNQLLITFSEPVAEANGNPLQAVDFLYRDPVKDTVPASNACLSGASGALTVGTYSTSGIGTNAMVVPLTLNGNLTTEDIIGTPSNAFCIGTAVLGDAISPNPALIFESAAGAGGKAAFLVDSQVIPAPTARETHFLDNGKPYVKVAGFIDAPSGTGPSAVADGRIDAVKVQFNEMVVDASALVLADWTLKVGTQSMIITKITTGQAGGGPVGTSTCTDGVGNNLLLQPSEKIPPVPGVIAVTDATTMGATVTSGTALFNNADLGWPIAGGSIPNGATITAINSASSVTISPPAAAGLATAVTVAFGRSGVNDDTIFLCLDQTKTLAQGGTRDAGTGITTGTLVYVATGAPLTDRAALSTVLGSQANKMDDTLTPIAVKDLARPVILNVEEPNASPPVSTHVETADLNGTGHIDGVKITFSEPIVDSTVAAAAKGEFTVSDRSVKGMNTGTAANDAVVYITFAPSTTFDTGTGGASTLGVTEPAAPRVTYTDGGSVKDPAGNIARPLAYVSACTGNQPGCAVVLDGANPRVISVQASVGSDLVNLAFSEPVGHVGQVDSLSALDVSYLNLKSASDGSDASGVLQVARSSDGTTATVRLNHKLTQDDFDNDKLAFPLGVIVEAGGSPDSNTASIDCQTVTDFNSCRRLALGDSAVRIDGKLGDRVAPGAPVLKITSDHIFATALNLTWTAPIDTDLASYKLYYCNCTLTASTYATATGVLSFTANLPTPAAGLLQYFNKTGLVLGKNYDFALVVFDTNGNFQVSNIVRAKTAIPDTVLPGLPGDLKAASGLDGKSVTLSWTAPADDSLDPASGKVSGYECADSTGPITAANFLNNKVPCAFGSIVEPGGTQTATVANLKAGTSYTFAVRAFDERPNFGPVATLDFKPTALPEDLNAPNKITNLVATDGSPAYNSVKLTWTAPSDNDDTVGSYLVFYGTTASGAATGTQAPSVDFVPSTLAGAGQTQTATVKGLSGGQTYYFVVRAADRSPARNQAEASNVANHTTTKDPSAVTPEVLKNANIVLNDPPRIKHTAGSGNFITWDLPTPTPKGIQIWVLNGNKYTLVATLDDQSAGFKSSSFQDPDTTATASDLYKLTAYYGQSADQGYVAPGEDPSVVLPYFNALHATSANSGIPTWVWYVAGAVLLLIIVVVVLLVLRRRRQPAAEGEEAEGAWGDMPAEGEENAWAEAPTEETAAEPEEAPMETPSAEAPAWKESAASQAATQQVTASPTSHYVNCPKCATGFRATGIKPLAIECPSCGVRGTLR